MSYQPEVQTRSAPTTASPASTSSPRASVPGAGYAQQQAALRPRDSLQLKQDPAVQLDAAPAPAKRKYAASGGQHEYSVDGQPTTKKGPGGALTEVKVTHDVIVFLPPGGLVGPTMDVFVFFHGMGGDYASKSSNTAKNSNLPQAIAASGKVGLAPVGGAGANWETWAPGDFKSMVDDALARVSADEGVTPAVKAGSVSIAGHSAGGKALGQAALDLDAPEVTLQDAGYGKFKGAPAENYIASWDKLGKWFLAGKSPKTLRVISHDAKGTGAVDASTRYAVENADHGFSEAALKATMAGLVASGAITAPLTLTTEAGDRTPRVGSGGGMRLESKLTATRADGGHQGTMYLYHLPTSHDGVRNETMGAAAKGGGDNFGALDLKKGSYLVTDGAAVIRDPAALSKPKKGPGGKPETIPKGETVQVTEFASDGGVFANVAGYGWTKLSNLKAAE